METASRPGKIREFVDELHKNPKLMLGTGVILYGALGVIALFGPGA